MRGAQRSFPWASARADGHFGCAACVAQVFEELEKFGKIEELNVCANLGDHMIGNVYVKYDEEEMAEKALNALNGRFYAGRLIMAEYSPVTDFREFLCGVCATGVYAACHRLRWLTDPCPEQPAARRPHLCVCVFMCGAMCVYIHKRKRYVFSKTTYTYTWIGMQTYR